MAKLNESSTMVARTANDTMAATWRKVSHELCGGFRPLREQALYDALVSRTLVEAERLGYASVMLYLINNPADATQLAAAIAK